MEMVEYSNKTLPPQKWKIRKRRLKSSGDKALSKKL
jgi:hypothetical protein